MKFWRQAFLMASVITSCFMVYTVELLNLGNAVAFGPFLTSWLLFFGIAAGLFYRSWKNHKSHAAFVEREPFSRMDKILLGGVGVYVLIIGMIALVAPPNTWDVMEYHMSKVMHWIQNGNVKFIPTHMPRLNHQNPGSEFLLLHLQLLSGSDRFANLVSWHSMVGALIAVSLIAKQLGAGVRGQFLATVFAATLPMGIMQASSSQADFVSAFWMASFVCFIFEILQIKTAFHPGPNDTENEEISRKVAKPQRTRKTCFAGFAPLREFFIRTFSRH